LYKKKSNARNRRNNNANKGSSKYEDSLLVVDEVSPEPIDYAEETGSVIVHFTKEGKPVLLEIMDASKFLAETSKARKRAKSKN